MVRVPSQSHFHPRCSPHPRGDGPTFDPISDRAKTFSPPAWGWSGLRGVDQEPAFVLPTRVGMVRTAPGQESRALRSPHPRGDGPSKASWPRSRGWFSPPAWGWSGVRHSDTHCADVLPTRVGMVRPLGIPQVRFDCSPHPRGDGPGIYTRTSTVNTFSPPAWGWSAPRRRESKPTKVLPTRVGMVRMVSFRFQVRLRSPHPRGDGPLRCLGAKRGKRFSPPAWGWSELLHPEQEREPVLPTRVGMVRGSCRSATCSSGSPHPRGDGPLAQVPVRPAAPFSPPAWGWSALPAFPCQFRRVLPTRVGMVQGSVFSDRQWGRV